MVRIRSGSGKKLVRVAENFVRIREIHSDGIKEGPKEKLTFQLLFLVNNFVELRQDNTLQFALVSFQFPMVPKEVLEESSPKVVGIL